MDIMGFKDRVTRMVQFSDSIIIASLDDSKSALNKIVKAGVVLMQNALETGFALKGAIGRSIVDAYLLEEELKFYGVVFHHSVEELIQQYKDIPPIRGKREQKIPVSEYQIHLKSGRSTHYVYIISQADQGLIRGGLFFNIGKAS